MSFRCVRSNRFICDHPALHKRHLLIARKRKSLDIRNVQRINAAPIDGRLLRRPALDALLDEAAARQTRTKPSLAVGFAQ